MQFSMMVKSHCYLCCYLAKSHDLPEIPSYMFCEEVCSTSEPGNNDIKEQKMCIHYSLPLPSLSPEKPVRVVNKATYGKGSTGDHVE